MFLPLSGALAAIQSNILTRSAFQLKLEKLNKVYLYSVVASCALASVMCFDYLSGNLDLKLTYLIAPVVAVITLSLILFFNSKKAD